MKRERTPLQPELTTSACEAGIQSHESVIWKTLTNFSFDAKKQFRTMPKIGLKIVALLKTVQEAKKLLRKLESFNLKI